MTAAGFERDVPARAEPVLAVLRIGLRELRGGVHGFKIFIACLALGVMVIAAVGALADALKAGFARQGEIILGGDLTLSRMHTRATPAERGVLDGLGTVSETATLRTMARTPDGSEQALAELKAVDTAYPLVGAVELEAGGDFASALAGNGAAGDAMLLERLGVKPGATLKIGNADVVVRAVLKSEPDGVSDRLTYGPRIFLSEATLAATGLVQPGTLIRWRYAVELPAGAPDDRAALAAIRAGVAKALPEAGFTALDRHDPSPQITRTLDRLRQFLILIGLASLIVGGVGVANAVATFIDKRVKVIATLRSIGATGRQITALFIVQVLIMAAIGIAIGLAGGVLVPGLLDQALGDALPVRTEFAVSPRSLAIAAAYGFLIALIFALWPLGYASRVRASVLFRDATGSARGWPAGTFLATIAVLAVMLFGLALATSEPKSLVVYIAIGLAVTMAVFTALGEALTRLARRLPRPKSVERAIALRNVGAPDGLTQAVVLSLGTGLSLLVAVALANVSLVKELGGRLPETSPDYFLLDVPKGELDGLTARVVDRVPGTVISAAPMLRGRLVRIKDTPVEDYKAPADAQWVLNGDRGLSYASTIPEGSHVTAGEWWRDGYDGPPLVSFEAELAKKLGLTVGDKVTVNVLGRNIDATISNFREVKWETIAINFVMVFSPNTLSAAPHNLLATITLPKDKPAGSEVELVRDLGRTYPAISAIRVRDAINQFNQIFSKVMNAVRVAGGVTLLAGALVLAGAMAAAQRRRTLEAVILKTIGASRRQILLAHAYEYVFLAIIAGIVAVLIGSLAAYGVVTFIMEVAFSFSLTAVLQILGFAIALVVGFGAAGTASALRAKPVPFLRTE